MTAHRIIDDHDELENSGDVSHSELDSFVVNSSWIVLSGTAGPVPSSARRLKAGTNITFIDGGPGEDLVISAAAVAGGNISWMERPSGSVDGVNVTFTLVNSPSPSTGLMFFVNGLVQSQGASDDFTLTGSIITCSQPPRSGSNLFSTYPY